MRVNECGVVVKVSLRELAAALGGDLFGDPDQMVSGIAALAQAQAEHISFVSHPRYRTHIQSTRAACLIVPPDLLESARLRGACIVTPDPYLYYARLSQWWRARATRRPTAGRHPTAWVADDADVHPSASLGPFAVVESGACVGEGASIGAHALVGPGARIGESTVLHARVTVGADCQVGARCILHPGVVIGADGFGFAPHQGEWVKIEQLGAVVLGDDCEVGANTCIDRGALGDTVLGVGVKLDNLIQIGHNVRIGDHTAMAGCVGVAGSAVIGAHCTVGGGAVVLGHLSLADGVHISAASVVTKSIRQPGHYSGVFPLDDNARWEKNAATLKQLHALRERVRQLEQRETR